MIYLYSNKDQLVERSFPMGTAPRRIRVGCRTFHRDIVAEHSPRVRSSKGMWPLHPEALAVNPEDAGLAESDATKEGVPTRFDPKTGCPEIRDRSHYKRYCETYGFYMRNAGYGDAVPQGR